MSVPSRVVPSRNWTVVTVPSGSLAVAVMVIVGFHGKTAPSAGDVMLAAGGWFCVAAGLTVIVDTGLVVLPHPRPLPWRSAYTCPVPLRSTRK